MKSETTLIQAIAPMDGAVLSRFMRVEERKYPGNRCWRILEKSRQRRLVVFFYALAAAGLGFMAGKSFGWQYAGTAAALIVFLAIPWAILRAKAVQPARWQPATRDCHYFGYRNANRKLGRLRPTSALFVEELVLRRPKDEYPLAAALCLVLEKDGQTVRRGMSRWPL